MSTIILLPVIIRAKNPYTEYSSQQFDIDVYSESKEKQPVKDLVKSKLVPQLRKEFRKLAPALIAEHGKDIQHAPGSNPSSGFSTPKTLPQKAAAAPVASTSTTQSNNGKAINTTTVTDSEEFRTTAEELYKTFTDPQRLAAFTRAPPKVFEGARKGGKFELFGGNVVGEYLELEESKKIVQSWRLQQWPAGHFSKLEIEFDQNDVDGVTVMRVNWTGVPVGQEDVTKENWQTYYVHSIKQTFGQVGPLQDTVKGIRLTVSQLRHYSLICWLVALIAIVAYYVRTKEGVESH